MPQPIQIPISSPVQGVNRVVNREGQSPGNCWDALNVLPYDRFGRHRVAQRFGTAKLYSTALGSTQIQGLLPIYNISYGGSFVATHTQPFTPWIHLPIGGSTSITVSTSTNNLFFTDTGGGDVNGSISAGTDNGPQFNSTVLNYGQGFQLSFDVNYTYPGFLSSGPTDAFLWVYIPVSSTATTFADTPRMQAYFDFSPIGNGYAELDGSTGSGTGTYIGESVSTPPSISIPVTINWTESGDASATLNGVATDYNFTGPNVGYVNIPRSGAGYHFQFFAELPTNQVGSVNNVGGTMTLSNIVLSYGAPSPAGGAVSYQTLLIAVCGGYLFVGDSFGNLFKPTIGQSGAPSISSTAPQVGMCYADGVVFIADGSSTLWGYTLLTSTLAAVVPVPSPGNITGIVPTDCNLCCNWRGRVVVAGDSNNPQNVYFSRPSGTYFNSVTSTEVLIGPGVDWDYSQSDPAAAFASNLATSGKIGQPVMSLIPFSDDLLKVGCSHSLWMYQGDPADGGSCVNVSQLLGICGPNAWCVDPAGTLWFVATGGLFSVRPAWEFYRPPEAVTVANVNTFFDALDPGSTAVTLVYDADSHYLHVLMTPTDQLTVGTHLTLDTRDPQNPAFFPQSFPVAQGPNVSCIFFADANPNNRTIAFGGQDGYIRSWGEFLPRTTAPCVDDDGVPINAYVVLGPYNPVPGQAATLTGVTLNLAEIPPGLSSTQWSLAATTVAGPTAYDVTEGTGANQHAKAVVGMVLDRRQKTFRQRLRGGFFTLTLANTIDTDLFGLESGVLEFLPSGRERNFR